MSAYQILCCSSNYLIYLHKICFYFASCPQAFSVTAVRNSESYFGPFITNSIAITDRNSQVRAIKKFFMLLCRYHVFTI